MSIDRDNAYEATIKMLKASQHSDSIKPDDVDNRQKLLEKIEAHCPALKDGQFLIPIKQDIGDVVFCMRELSWAEAQTIDSQCFRTNDKQVEYFAGAFEQREILKRAICWAFDLNSKQMVYNKPVGTIISVVDYDMMALLWVEYQQRTALTTKEATALYNSALKYFKGEAQLGYPVPPLVTEVDFLFKGVQWTRDEFRSVTASDLERIQLILTARADALGFAPENREAEQSVKQMSPTALSPELISTLPPHIRERYQQP